MKRAELLRTLEALHRDLSEADKVDPEAERLLRTVTADIERLLDERQETPADDPKSLSSKLESLVLSWEADHPKIARLIGQAADALANIGI